MQEVLEGDEKLRDFFAALEVCDFNAPHTIKPSRVSMAYHPERPQVQVQLSYQSIECVVQGDMFPFEAWTLAQEEVQVRMKWECPDRVVYYEFNADRHPALHCQDPREQAYLSNATLYQMDDNMKKYMAAFAKKAAGTAIRWASKHGREIRDFVDANKGNYY